MAYISRVFLVSALLALLFCCGFGSKIIAPSRNDHFNDASNQKSWRKLTEDYVFAGTNLNSKLPFRTASATPPPRFLSGSSSHGMAIEKDVHEKKPASAAAAAAAAGKQKLSQGDLDIVAERLGMGAISGGTGDEAPIDAEEILRIIEEKNPTLDELKEAFDLYDVNRDGFIDSKELQRVLCALGFEEGSSLEKCTRMLHAFDEDGDGRINFREFVKMMECPN